LGSVQQVYEASLATGPSFRAGLVVALVSALLFALVAWGLYLLLRPVNRELALLFLLLNAVGVAIQCASMLPLVSAMLQSDPATHMQVFSSEQLAGLGSLAASTYKTGFVTAQLFFGAWLFPLGYLVYRSRFLPRFLGVLLLLDGVAVLIWFLQALLAPAHHAISTLQARPASASHSSRWRQDKEASRRVMRRPPGLWPPSVGTEPPSLKRGRPSHGSVEGTHVHARGP
jgi:hypothetical protein